MLHIIIGTNWRNNRREILSRVARDVKEGQEGRILIVPELVSHEMERALCQAAGDTASRYAEVLSFSRLARRSAESSGNAARQCLDNGGRVVALASAARQLSSRLKAYAAVESRPEFLQELLDGIDEFKRCCITPGDLSLAASRAEGSLAQKLEELSLLMESYDSLCARGKRDPRDQMNWLLEQLEAGDYGEKHTFYVDGFPDFTRQNLAILFCLMEKSENLTVSLNCDAIGSHMLAFEKAGATARELLAHAKKAGVEAEIITVPDTEDGLLSVRQGLFQGPIFEAPPNRVRAVRAESAWQECLAAAQVIRDGVLQGGRFRDFTVVCSDMNRYLPLLELVFSRMQIPLYQSGTEDILQKSMISTVLTALDAAQTGYEKKTMLQYLRSSLSPLDPDEADLVENYMVVWSIRGGLWSKAWTQHPEGLKSEFQQRDLDALARLNALRVRVITPLETLRVGFEKATCLKDQVLALYRFLQDMSLSQKLTQLSQELDDSGDNRNAQILGQLWDIFISALEQLYDVLGETHWDGEHFSRLLKLLLSQYDVGTIPPVLDSVQVGPVNAMRCHAGKHLLVLGVQEGSLPGYSGSNGVLTDQERVALRQLGVPLTGGAMEGIQSEFGEIYGIFCGCTESIWASCSSEQPSFVFRRLVQLAGGEETAEVSLGFAGADAVSTASYLSGLHAMKTAGRLGLEKEYAEISRHRDYRMGTLSKDAIRGLYGKELQLSASQVDTVADCRMLYFLKYGIKAKERKEAAIDPAEFGTYVHAVLEETAREVMEKGGFHQITLDETLVIAHRHSSDYVAQRFSQLGSQRLTYLLTRNQEELDMVVEELWTELKDAAFAPRGFEVGFGTEDGALPPIEIPNGYLHAILRGFVDRVDTWQSPGSLYYRIVDYKTGKKDFDYCDVFQGIGLQMLLYLFALEHCGADLFGGKAVGAGIQYFPARAPYLPASSELSEEAASELRIKQWKRKGLLLDDRDVLYAMEPTEQPQRLDYSCKKDGSISGNIAAREQFSLLERYVFRVLGKLVETIATGDITPNPYARGNNHDACRFCPYGLICSEKAQAGKRNYKTMTAQRFWEEVGKEMQHG